LYGNDDDVFVGIIPAIEENDCKTTATMPGYPIQILTTTRIQTAVKATVALPLEIFERTVLSVQDPD
jgi:hypothetical protein